MSGLNITPGARLFFALWPPHAIANTISQVTTQLLTDAGGKKPQQCDQLHLTLAFLGNIPSKDHPCILKVADTIQVNSFELILNTLGYFDKAQVIWLAPQHTPAALTSLYTQLQQGLLECSVKLDTRPFVPHMTLQRKARCANSTTHIASIPWSVQEFVLAQSVTYTDGAKYEVLKKWQLQDS